MEPQFEYHPAVMIAGVQEHGLPKDIDYKSLWADRYMKFDAYLRPYSIDEAYYGVSFCSGADGVVDYVAGMAVEGLTSAPESLVLRELPAARFAIFPCTIQTIGQAYQEIYEQWLPQSPYDLDTTSADYEYYPPGTDSENALVLIYVPVRVRQQFLPDA
jgi:predicted transcriptional regulator YdeE